MKTKETNRWSRNKNLKASGCLAAAAILAIASNPLPASAAVQNGWETADGKQYWYENGIRQGYDPDNSAYRGKEIYDKGTDAWYWLDNVQQGAKAVSKDVYQESQADDSGTTGKWVRYDADGHMIKGWDYTDNGIYYFDLTYGTMYKGYKTIDGVTYYFDENTGITDRDPVSGQNGWVTIDGKQYWYENGIRQGYDPSNPSYRGKEIYDQDSDAWYWLDNIQQGAKTVSKDVYQESAAGQWADNAESGTGKWVRYDAEGHMIKGWSTNENGTYYFDPAFGTMAKGTVTIDGKQYEFDNNTGILLPTDVPPQTNLVPGNTYILNTDRKKIHLPNGCHTIKLIKAENYFESGNTLESLEEMGYTTCGHCW